jgi:uncharacterized protein involved in outer membrane biogenesis
VVVDRIVVDGPVVNLVRDAAGQMNVDTLGHRGEKAPKPADAAGDGERGGRPAIQLASLRLRHGTIRYRDRATGRAFALDDVGMDAREPQFGGPIPVSLRARLASDDLRLDDIESEGVLDLAGERPVYRGTLSAGPGALGALPLERIEATMRAAPPELTFEQATVAVLDGTVRGKGRLASSGDGAGLAAELDASGLDLARLPVRPDKPHPAGRLALQATLSGPAPGSPRFRAGLVGSGRFAVADGRIEDVPLGRTVRDILTPLLGADTAARLRDRYPDLFGGDDLRFTRLAGSGRLAGGRITSDDLVLAGASYQASGSGSFGLDATIDVALRLVASPALTDDLLGKSKARPVLVDANGQLAVPLRVRGPLHHPHVTPDPEFAATVARGLLGGTGLEDVAGGLLERFLGGKRERKRE